MADIAILIGILGIELFKALRYAAQNRILQKKWFIWMKQPDCQTKTNAKRF